MTRLIAQYRLRLANLLQAEHHAATRFILTSAASVAIAHLIVRMASMLKELMLASTFGASWQLDAYLISYSLVVLLSSVLGSAFASSFLPIYVSTRESEGCLASSRLAGQVLIMVTLTLIGVALTMVGFVGHIVPLLAQYVSAEHIALTRHLLLIMSPTLVAVGASAVLTSILNAEQRNMLPAAISVIVPLSIMLDLALAKYATNIDRVAWGLTIGCTLESLLLLTCVLFKKCIALPDTFRWNAKMLHITKQYGPLFFGAVMMSSAPLINQSMATADGPGSVSALSYGNKIVGLIVSVGSLSLCSAAFPHFARLAAARRWTELRYSVKTQVQIVFLLCIPVALVLAVGSPIWVRWLYQRGAFTAEDTSIVAQIQVLYALQIPFYLSGMIGVRMLSAMNCNHILLLISGCDLALVVVGNYFFRSWLGLPGIALSTSCVYIFSSTMIFSFVFHRLKRLEAEAK